MGLSVLPMVRKRFFQTEYYPFRGAEHELVQDFKRAERFEEFRELLVGFSFRGIVLDQADVYDEGHILEIPGCGTLDASGWVPDFLTKEAVQSMLHRIVEDTFLAHALDADEKGPLLSSVIS